MALRPDNVVSIRPGHAFLKDTFSPLPLPPLLELRVTMGLTFEEALSILFISVDSLNAKETSLEEPPAPYNVSTVKYRYLFYLSQYGERRPRNIIRDHLTLKQVRQDIFYFDLATMGSMYGGYTARQWYNFEIHKAILPRTILAMIDEDAHKMQSMRY